MATTRGRSGGGSGGKVNSIDIRIKNKAEFERLMKGIERFPDEYAKELGSGIARFATKKIKEESPVGASGRLRAGIKNTARRPKKILNGYQWTVYPTVPYAFDVHTGHRPLHNAGRSASQRRSLQRWIDKKVPDAPLWAVITNLRRYGIRRPTQFITLALKKMTRVKVLIEARTAFTRTKRKLRIK